MYDDNHGINVLVALSTFPSFATAEDLNLDGAHPRNTGCSLDGVVKASKRLTDGSGTVELRYSPKCKTAWARIILDSIATYNWEANVMVIREHDGKAYACQHSGGNGVVNKGQRFCYTPMVYDGALYRAQAIGGHLTPDRRYLGSATTAFY